MKNKSIAIVLFISLMICCGLALAACDGPLTESHTHTYSSNWSMDTESHWHAATCEHADKVSDKAEHNFGEDNICTECGYEQGTEPHIHTFAESWTNDSDYHWHAATCEHSDEISGKAKHSYGSDDKCTDCGYEKPSQGSQPSEGHTHTYSDEWAHDGTYHWHPATCGHDDAIKQEEHSFDGNGDCICGVSAKVDSETWAKAFGFANADNFTLVMDISGMPATFKFANGLVYTLGMSGGISSSGEVTLNEAYYQLERATVWEYAIEDGVWVKREFDRSAYESMLSGTRGSLYLFDVLAVNFDYAVYESGSYRVSLDSVTVTVNGDTQTMYGCTYRVTLVDGKATYVSATMYGDAAMSKEFMAIYSVSDIGTTTVTLPQVGSSANGGNSGNGNPSVNPEPTDCDHQFELITVGDDLDHQLQCSICKYFKLERHNFVNHKCTVCGYYSETDGGGAVGDKPDHDTPSGDGKPNGENHKHHEGGKPKYVSETQHAWLCIECGEPYRYEQHMFFEIERGDDEGHYYVCECGASLFEEHSWEYMFSDDYEHVLECRECHADKHEQHNWSECFERLEGHAYLCDICWHEKWEEHHYVDGVCQDCGWREERYE